MTVAHNNGRKADGVCERLPAAEVDSAERCCSFDDFYNQWRPLVTRDRMTVLQWVTWRVTRSA